MHARPTTHRLIPLFAALLLAGVLAISGAVASEVVTAEPAGAACSGSVIVIGGGGQSSVGGGGTCNGGSGDGVRYGPGGTLRPGRTWCSSVFGPVFVNTTSASNPSFFDCAFRMPSPSTDYCIVHQRLLWYPATGGVQVLDERRAPIVKPVWMTPNCLGDQTWNMFDKAPCGQAGQIQAQQISARRVIYFGWYYDSTAAVDVAKPADHPSCAGRPPTTQPPTTTTTTTPPDDPNNTAGDIHVEISAPQYPEVGGKLRPQTGFRARYVGDYSTCPGERGEGHMLTSLSYDFDLRGIRGYTEAAAEDFIEIDKQRNGSSILNSIDITAEFYNATRDSARERVQATASGGSASCVYWYTEWISYCAAVDPETRTCTAYDQYPVRRTGYGSLSVGFINNNLNRVVIAGTPTPRG